MSLARLIPPPLKGPHLISRHLAPPFHLSTYAHLLSRTPTHQSQARTPHTQHATRTTLSSGVRRTVLRSVASQPLGRDAVYPVPQPASQHPPHGTHAAR
eukprot:scaffold15012_cov58-Phaeocystis_antarctica.AAC.1